MCPEIVHNTTALPFWHTAQSEFIALAQGRPPDNDQCDNINLYSYIGGRGSGTALHQDSVGINFWMAVATLLLLLLFFLNARLCTLDFCCKW